MTDLPDFYRYCFNIYEEAGGLMDSKLQQARNYEEIYGDRIPKAERPLYPESDG